MELAGTAESETPFASRERWAAFMLLGLVFAFGLFDHSLWSANDSREGAMIQEMFRTGRWLTPLFNGQLYLEKPPLLHWTALLFCHLFNTVNEGLLRLPAALYGFGAVVLVILLGRAMGRERAGIAAAFMCALSAQYLEYSKVVLTDLSLTFMVMLSFYIFLKAYAAHGARLPLWGLFILVSALSFYAKGLLGPGLIWISAGVFLAYRREWRLFFILPLVFIPVFLLVLAPWVWGLWREGGSKYLATALWANQFGRFLSFNNPNLPLDPYFVHKEPITYYLIHLPLRLMPWTLLAPPALVYWFRKGGAPADATGTLVRIALLSMAAILHLSSAKAACYALPLYPILFLMIGVWLEDAAAGWASKIERWLIGITFITLAAVAVAVPLVFAGAYLLHLKIIRDAGAYTAAFGFCLALLALATGLSATRRLWRQFREGARRQTLFGALLAAAAMLIINASALIPIYDYQRTYKPLADMVRHELAMGRRIGLANTKERDRGQFMFYLNRQMPVVSVSSNLDFFLYSRPRPAGVILPKNQLTNPAVLRLTSQGKPVRIVKCSHSGYKCREFVLLLNEGP